jgi:hypothetical protein
MSEWIYDAIMETLNPSLWLSDQEVQIELNRIAEQNTNQAPQPTGGRGRFFRGETDCPGAGKIVCAIPLLGPLAASTIPVFRALDLRYPTRFSPIVARIRLRRLADFAYIESTSAARFAPGGRM